MTPSISRMRLVLFLFYFSCFFCFFSYTFTNNLLSSLIINKYLRASCCHVFVGHFSRCSLSATIATCRSQEKERAIYWHRLLPIVWKKRSFHCLPHSTTTTTGAAAATSNTTAAATVLPSTLVFSFYFSNFGLFFFLFHSKLHFPYLLTNVSSRWSCGWLVVVVVAGCHGQLIDYDDDDDGEIFWSFEIKNKHKQNG